MIPASIVGYGPARHAEISAPFDDDMADDPIFLHGATKLDLFTIITGQYNNSCT